MVFLFCNNTSNAQKNNTVLPGSTCRMGSQTINDSIMSTVAYNSNNNMVGIYSANSVNPSNMAMLDSTVFVYDNQNRLSSSVVYSKSYSSTLTERYYYNQSGKLVRLARIAAMAGGQKQDSILYQYPNTTTINTINYSTINLGTITLGDTTNEKWQLDANGNVRRVFKNVLRTFLNKSIPTTLNRDSLLLVEEYNLDNTHPIPQPSNYFSSFINSKIQVNNFIKNYPVQITYYDYTLNGPSVEKSISQYSFTNFYDNSGNLIQSILSLSGPRSGQLGPFKFSYQYTCN